MQITLLRKMEYEEQFIYVMQFGITFQYLLAINGRIYQDNIDLKPGLKKKLLWKLGRLKTPYTADELDDGEQIVLSGAMATVDKLKEQNKIKADPEAKKEIERVRKERKLKKNYKCEWQARETNDGFYYTCLVHGVAVKVKDGEKPSHD